jgi:uncharacterized integral membrane protein
MGLLKGLRAATLLVVMFLAMGFAFLNNRELVDVNLYWGRFQDAPMAWVVFVAFLLGALVGYSLSLFLVIELQGRIREMRRRHLRMEGELTTLRNLPLDDAEEHALPAAEHTV